MVSLGAPNRVRGALAFVGGAAVLATVLFVQHVRHGWPFSLHHDATIAGRAATHTTTRAEGSTSRVAVSVDLGDWPVDPEVRANTLAVGDALRAAGATVDEVDVKVPYDDVQLATAILFALGFGDWVGSQIPEHGEQLTAYAIEMARWCKQRADRRVQSRLELEPLEERVAGGELLDRKSVV